MKLKLAIFAVLLLKCGAHVLADNHRQQFVVNAFATPVGVPLSPYSPYAYSSSQQQQQQYSAAPRSAEDILVDRLAEKLLGKLAEKDPTQVRALAAKQTAFGTSCVACHLKPASIEAGAPHFTTLDVLTGEQRLHAIDAIANDRMPKGGKLTAEKAGALIRELSSKPAKTPAQSDVPPAPPSPEEIGESQ